MSTKATIAFAEKGILFLLFLFLFVNSKAGDKHQTDNATSPVGRWDITVDADGKPQPSWLGVWLSGNNTLVGAFVSTGGSARPISHVMVSNDSFHFSIPPQWDRDTADMVVKGRVQGDNATGTLVYPNGKQYNWTAVRAPSLTRTTAPVWGKPMKIFNGKDLSGWHATGNNQWVVENGILKSPHSGSNLVSDGKYKDFKLHVEFRYPEHSNSGVYLRGRYEVQIVDGDTTHPDLDLLGAVYGFIAPSEKAGKKAGEWQAYDITLAGRMVTVVLNGVTVIANREIPGITGGALDSQEGEAGPLQFQGDHGPIEFRNIVMTEGK